MAELTADRAKLERAIADVRPTYRATDITGALKRAAQILENAARPERRVYLISDLAAHGFVGRAAVGRRARTRAGAHRRQRRQAGRQPRHHRRCKTEPAPHLGPRGVRISVEVANFGDEPLKELPVTLRVDGKAVAKGLVDVPAHERAQKRFFHVLRAARPTRARSASTTLDGRARRPTRCRSTIAASRASRCAAICACSSSTAIRAPSRRDDEVFYLETALRPGDRDDSQLDVTTVAADELASRRLADFDVVFLCNVKTPDGAALQRLRAARRRPLRRARRQRRSPTPTTRARRSPAAAAAGAAHRRRHRRRSRRRRAARRRRPATRSGSAASTQPSAAGAASASARRRGARGGALLPLRAVPPDGARAQRQVLLRFADGAPALLEGALGAGRVLVLGVHRRSRLDRPAHPARLPAADAAGRRATWRARRCASPRRR